MRARHHRVILSVTTAGLLLATGCAGALATRPVDPMQAAMPLDVLYSHEIDRSSAGSAYLALQQLRPHFLRLTRRTSVDAERPVYVDGLRFGGIGRLHALPAAQIRQIRLLNSREATMRYGEGHSNGAIEIQTKSGG